MRVPGILTVMMVAFTGVGAAQSVEGGRAGVREVLDRDEEMSLAVSAAPPAVSDGARVLLWDGEHFVVGREGENGVTCYVARSWPESREPHCFDEEGARTILPIHLRQMEMWNAGKSKAEIDAEIGEGLRTGRFRLPTRPVMSFMMSARQELISDDGRPVGAWEPHLMIYFPYLSQEGLGLGFGMPSLDAAVVNDPSTPLSNIMIVVKDFAETSSGGELSR